MRRPLLASLALAAVACDGSGAPASPPDAAIDAAIDAAAVDAGPEFPEPGFGRITGDCDVLDTELTAAAPSTFESAIDFAHPFTDADLGALTPGGQEIIADGNAGGSSLDSEVFAYEVLARCEEAALLQTETEITYDTPDTAITDLRVSIDEVPIGVSVTRAVAFPFDDPYTVDQARALLEKKLGDILESSANVSAEDHWAKQILAILAYGPDHADAVATAYAGLDPALTADTIVWVVVTDGADDFIY